MRTKLRPRLLPATIAVATALLTTKLVGLGMALLPAGYGLDTAVVSQAAAASADAEHPAPKPATEHGQPKPAPESIEKHGVGETPLEQAEAASPIKSPQPPAVSEAERQLLQDLRARRQELDARERTLAQREGVLDAAEQKLASRVTQLTALQSRLEQLETQRHERDEANWSGLVKVYETMKPRDAATIFNDMDMTVLLQVTDRMKEVKLAQVLAAMLPDRARLVTSQLAAQRTRALAIPPEQHPDAG